MINFDSSVEIDDLCLINNNDIIFKHQMLLYSELQIINSMLKIPTFYYNSEGSILIAFVLQNPNNVNLLIIQQVNNKYRILYPEEAEFYIRHKVKAVYYINPIDQSNKVIVDTEDHQLRKNIPQEFSESKGFVGQSSKRIKTIYLSDIPPEKRQQIQTLSEEYSQIPIDAIFMNTLLENNIVLPNDPNLSSMILDLLSYPDYKNLSMISFVYKSKVTNYLYSKFYQKYPYLNKVENIVLTDLMNLVGNLFETVDKFKDDDFSIVDWAAECGYINILDILFNGIMGPDNKLIRLFPTQFGMIKAIQKNQQGVFDWIFEKVKIITPSFHSMILPNVRTLNNAAEYGNLQLLIQMERYGILPDNFGASYAATQGHINVLEWLAPLKVEEIKEDLGSKIIQGDQMMKESEVDLGSKIVQGDQMMKEAEVDSGSKIVQEDQMMKEVEVEVEVEVEAEVDLGSKIIEDTENKIYSISDIDLEKRSIVYDDKTRSPIIPSQDSLVDIIIKNHLDVLIWLKKRGILSDIGKETEADALESQEIYENGLEVPMTDVDVFHKIYMTRDNVNDAAGLDKIDILQWIEQNIIILNENNIFVPMLPNSHGAKNAVMNNRVNVLNWLEQRNITPNYKAAIQAAQRDSLDSLIWMYERRYFTLPGEKFQSLSEKDFYVKIVDNAAGSLSMNVLKWFRDRNIYPTRKGFNLLLKSMGDYDMDNFLQIVTDFHNRNIYPDLNAIKKFINNSIQYGRYNVLVWIITDEAKRILLDRSDILILESDAIHESILPDQYPIDLAAQQGLLNILILLANRKCVANTGEVFRLLPSRERADKIIIMGKIDVAIWLQQQGIIPETFNSKQAAYHGHIRILEYMEKLGVKFSVDDANEAAKMGRLNTIIWFQQRGILPNIIGLREAKRFGQINVLLWMTSRKEYFPQIKFIS